MMMDTGISRKLDALGRIVLPKELRTTMGVDVLEPIEFFEEDNMIILKKYEPGCCFCGDVSDSTVFKGKKVCFKCRGELKNKLF